MHATSETSSSEKYQFLLKLVAVIIACLIGGFCLRYSINHWLIWAGRPPQFPFWLGALVGCLRRGGFICLILALLTLITTYFV